jgi:hypothetical protein
VIRPQYERGALFTRQLRDGLPDAHAGDSLRSSANTRSPIGSTAGALTLTRFKQTLTPIRYSHVAIDD